MCLNNCQCKKSELVNKDLLIDLIANVDDVIKAGSKLVKKTSSTDVINLVPDATRSKQLGMETFSINKGNKHVGEIFLGYLRIYKEGL